MKKTLHTAWPYVGLGLIAWASVAGIRRGGTVRWVTIVALVVLAAITYGYWVALTEQGSSFHRRYFPDQEPSPYLGP